MLLIAERTADALQYGRVDTSGRQQVMNGTQYRVTQWQDAIATRADRDLDRKKDQM
jgi:hypothetical protein